MSQISALIDTEKTRARREVKDIGMLGALLMALVLVLILYMLVNLSLVNWLFLAILIPIEVVLLIIIYKFEKATIWLDGVENWLEQSKRDYENKKRD
jgi:predicted tellurium resistance membrane protein TerC